MQQRKEAKAFTPAYLDALVDRSLHHAHAREIAIRLKKGNEAFFRGWFKDFKEIWSSEAEARAAFRHWRAARGGRP